ncbi:hypothetical protein BD413DRAFT_680093 [Trametes elegans]|nr:hypothetical protein BD413DRAFT_680093 [Trametes elegans]
MVQVLVPSPGTRTVSQLKTWLRSLLPSNTDIAKSGTGENHENLTRGISGYSGSSGISLESLPDDVALAILSFLTARDLITCRTTSRRMAALIYDNLSLQHLVELFALGMMDNPTSRLNIAERLHTLRAYHSQWKTAGFLLDVGLEQDAGGSTWEAQSSSDGSISYISRKDDSADLAVYSPPSILRRIAANHETIHLEHFAENICSRMIDVAQDLLVAAERIVGTRDARVSMRSLKYAGEAHPEAAPPIVRAAPRAQSGQAQPWLFLEDVRVYQQYVAWLLKVGGSGSSVLEIWDWKVGTLVWSQSFNGRLLYTFIDSEHIAVVGKAFSSPTNIVVYRFAPNHLDINATTQESKDHDSVCALQLPPLRQARAQTYVERITCTPGPPSSQRCVPFQLDPSTAVIAVNFGVVSEGDSPQFVLLIPLSTVYRQIASVRAPRDARVPARAVRVPARAVPWSDWGSRGSVLLHLPPPRTLDAPRIRIDPLRHRYGVLLHDTESSRQALGRVILLDFIPRVRRDASKAGAKRLAAAGASRGPWEEHFASPVRSKLLYDVTVGPRVAFPEPSNGPARLVLQQDGFTLMVAQLPVARVQRSEQRQVLPVRHAHLPEQRRELVHVARRHAQLRREARDRDCACICVGRGFERVRWSGGLGAARRYGGLGRSRTVQKARGTWNTVWPGAGRSRDRLLSSAGGVR